MYWNVYLEVLFPRVNRRLFETDSHLQLRWVMNKWNNAFTPLICLLGVHSNHFNLFKS